MSENTIIVIGSSGHTRSVLDVIKAEGNYKVVGLIDDYQKPKSDVFGLKILGAVADLPEICEVYATRHFLVGIGDNYQRQSISDRISRSVAGAEFVSVVHPSAVIADDVEVGAGSVIMPSVTVVAGSHINEGCILNTASSLDHDGYMNSWSSLAPGVVTGGNIILGKRSSIGVGTSVVHNVEVGEDTVIGAGAVVIKDIPARVVVYGNPCQVIRSRRTDEKYL